VVTIVRLARGRWGRNHYVGIPSHFMYEMPQINHIVIGADKKFFFTQPRILPLDHILTLFNLIQILIFL
jgi:hypothetical protein